MLTVHTIVKKKDEMKAVTTTKRLSRLSKQCTSVYKEMGKLLLLWIKNKPLTGDMMMETITSSVWRDLLKQNPRTLMRQMQLKPVVAGLMADVVKSGWIQRYSRGHNKLSGFDYFIRQLLCGPVCGSHRSESFLDGGWRKVWVVLHDNSVLRWYKKQTDSDSKGDILLKEVCKWFSVGQYTNGMPDQPDLPAGAKLEHLLAIPVKPSSRAKIIWFLFTNDNELNEWMNAIVSVLPPAPRKSQQPRAAAVSAPYPTVQATQAGTVMAGAGYAVPSAPPANAPHPYSTHAPRYPQQAPYPQQASYPQQPGYPQQAAYPGYPQQAAYPQQAYYPQQPGYPQPYGYPQQATNAYPPNAAAYGQVPPPPPGYAGAYPGYYPQQGPYYGNTGSPQVVHIKEKNKSNIGEIALGVAGGALLAHGATSMMGGWGGGWGLGRWGSWSSLSSLSSFGSCGSFGSFGSFD
ncbi:uncharacterized protein LOC115221694 [Octopus sinensis]|uniref:Uncharacterized protein LOC115221694 n=1 Tax=Octopus sinensis TaxID=2607531 RepID=A0A7E6FI09_9MOLL|nr:uncharacterized protein LOC115221694 [Octopus sinensis]